MASCCVDNLGPILNDLLNCLNQSLSDCGAPVCKSFLAVSDVPPLDDCCDCGTGDGQAWVTVTNVNPNNVGTGGEVHRCFPTFVASVKLGIVRCAPTLNEAGEAPSEDALSLSTLAVLRDRIYMANAIRCCFVRDEDGYDVDDIEIGEWSSIGPEGGCVGGQQELTIHFKDRRCA